MTVTLEPMSLGLLDVLATGDLASAGRRIGRPIPPDFLDGQWIWQNLGDRTRDEPDLAWWLTQYLVLDDAERVVGHVRLFPPDGDEAQIGWHIDPIRRRQGFATAAAQALVEVAHARPEIQRLVALIAHDNVASQAVARRAGFRADGEQRHRFGWLMLRFVLDLRQ